MVLFYVQCNELLFSQGSRPANAEGTTARPWMVNTPAWLDLVQPFLHLAGAPGLDFEGTN